MQSLRTTQKVETGKAKLNEKWQNLDSDSKTGKQNYKQSKNIE